RRALSAERRALVRLLDAAQDLAADAQGRLLSTHGGHVEAALGVELGELFAEAVAAGGDGADAAPGAVAGLEDVGGEFAGGRVAVGADRPPVGVLALGAALLELPHRPQHAVEQVDRLEAADDDRDAVLSDDNLVLGEPHDRADVTWAEERLDSVVRRAQQ